MGTEVTVALISAGALVVGAVLTWLVGRKTASATDRRDATARDGDAVTHMRSVIDIVQAERKHTDEMLTRERERIQTLENQRETDRAAIDTLRVEVRGLRDGLDRLAGWARSMLQWAAEVTHPTPHPSIPDDIAHLIDTKP